MQRTTIPVRVLSLVAVASQTLFAAHVLAATSDSPFPFPDAPLPPHSPVVDVLVSTKRPALDPPLLKRYTGESERIFVSVFVDSASIIRGFCSSDSYVLKSSTPMTRRGFTTVVPPVLSYEWLAGWQREGADRQASVCVGYWTFEPLREGQYSVELIQTTDAVPEGDASLMHVLPLEKCQSTDSSHSTQLSKSADAQVVGPSVIETGAVVAWTFRVSKPQILKPEIVDAQGRLICHLDTISAAGGDNEIRWDGRDDDGTILPSGVYFLRIATSDGYKVKKAILVK